MIRDDEFINGFDLDRILGDLPIDIIKENIKTQIDDPLIFAMDQCDQFYQTMNEASEEFDHIDEYRYEIQEMKDDFNVFLGNELNNKFNLGIDMENMQSFELEGIVKAGYQFFVLDLKENITRFITNYILANKTSIYELFNDSYRRKDVTTTNMKKLTKNREDVVILSNIISVIYHILDLEHDPEDFMNLATEPGEYYGSILTEAVHDFRISNNFVQDILSEIKYNHNDYIDEIATEIILSMRDEIIDQDEE